VQTVHGGPRVWPSGYPDQYSTHSPFGPRETLGSCVKTGNIEREAFVLLARLKTPSADATACTTKLLLDLPARNAAVIRPATHGPRACG
jgi:hypothetical protein